MIRLLQALFSCAHDRTTFPQSPLKGHGHNCTVTCLDCGKTFSYDWDRMRIGKPVARSAPPPVEAPNAM